MTDHTHHWVDTDRQIDELAQRLGSVSQYSLDTEFHREKTYFPRLALIQISAGGRIALIDPLAVDATLLRPLFEGESLAVFHAAQQDLDVLTQSIGFVPARIFDTQLAAGFVGYSSPSLVNLAAGLLRVTVPRTGALAVSSCLPGTESSPMQPSSRNMEPPLLTEKYK